MSNTFLSNLLGFNVRMAIVDLRVYELVSIHIRVSILKDTMKMQTKRTQVYIGGEESEWAWAGTSLCHRPGDGRSGFLFHRWVGELKLT
jgi:hypothetical protein